MLKSSTARSIVGPSKQLFSATARIEPAFAVRRSIELRRCRHDAASTSFSVLRQPDIRPSCCTASQSVTQYRKQRLESPGLAWLARRRFASTDSTTTTTSPAVVATPAQNEPKQVDRIRSDTVTSISNQESSSPKAKLGELRRLASLAKPEQKTILTAIGLLFVSSAVSLSIPFTIGRIIDIFSSSSGASLPVSTSTAAVLLALFFGIGASANVARTILMRIAGQRIVVRLRQSAYTNVLKQDIGWHDLQGTVRNSSASDNTALPSNQALATQNKELAQKDTGVRSTGDIISRLGSDAGIVGESLTRELSDGLRALVTATVGIGAMFWISSKLTAVMLFIVPPISVAAVLYGRYLKTLSRRTQKAVGEMVAVSEERLGAIRTVHAFNTVEPAETSRFKEKVNKIFDLAKREAWASGLFMGGTGFAGNLTLLGLLTYGGTLVARGEISVGDLTSLLVYTFYSAFPSRPAFHHSS